MTLIPHDDVEVGRLARSGEPLLRSNLGARFGGHCEELSEPLVVENDDLLSVVSHRANGSAPMGDDGQRAYDEHRLRARHATNRFPRADRLSEADVVGEEEAAAPGANGGIDRADGVDLVRTGNDRRVVRILGPAG